MTEPGGSGAGSRAKQLIDREQKYPGELQDLRADLEAAQRERQGAIDALSILKPAFDRQAHELAQSSATEAELRAKVERRDAVIEAARLPAPTRADYYGRLKCAYCGDIEDDGHSESCPWLKLNVRIAALDAAEQPARAEGEG